MNKNSTNFIDIFNIEMIKLIKRKEWIVLLALGAISILFAVAILRDGYDGDKNQSALFWVYTQVFNSAVLFISPMVCAFIATRAFATEMENGSIRLYNYRFHSRLKMYLGKSLALTIFSGIIFILLVIMNILIYYILITIKSSSKFLSGDFLGNHYIYLILSTCMLFLLHFYFITQLSLFLSSYFKTTKVIAITFFISLFIGNTTAIPIVQNINPLYYILRFGAGATTTEYVVMNFNERFPFLITFLIICLVCTVIFNVLGIKKFKAKEF